MPWLISASRSASSSPSPLPSPLLFLDLYRRYIFENIQKLVLGRVDLLDQVLDEVQTAVVDLRASITKVRRHAHDLPVRRIGCYHQKHFLPPVQQFERQYPFLQGLGAHLIGQGLQGLFDEVNAVLIEAIVLKIEFLEGVDPGQAAEYSMVVHTEILHQDLSELAARIPALNLDCLLFNLFVDDAIPDQNLTDPVPRFGHVLPRLSISSLESRGWRRDH